uniref:Replication stress response regulator SDE2 n=1 Tax=Nothoprocta perdicaria TaxID=30464 RepID=A0A8C6ZW92_NOTPE
MALFVREPLAARARPLPLPPGGGSVRGLLRDRARALVSRGDPAAAAAAAAAAGGPRRALPARPAAWFVVSLCCFQNIPEDSLYVKCNGRLVDAEDALQSGAVYSLEPRLCGGKGGFGSMLRALGAQIEKTTNREACRDLSGRRLRDVNHEKAMAEWVKQQAEREAEKEQRRLERLQRKLAEPKHFFTNPSYQQQCHEMAERLEDSVLKGLQATSSKVVSPGTSNSRKRSNESVKKGTKYGKKRCFWMGTEELDDIDSSECSDDSEDDSAHASGGSCPSGSKDNENSENPNECSSSSVDVVKYQSATNPEKPPEHTEYPGRDLQGEAHTETPRGENSEMEKTLKENAQEKNKITKVLKEEEQDDVSSKAQETNQLQNTVSVKQLEISCIEENSCSHGMFFSLQEVEGLDLMAFSTASEMEVLGFEKLKLELMARGLKCGGTLQERATRLFSVRGLSRDQIDPALFAKPSKGKKK